MSSQTASAKSLGREAPLELWGGYECTVNRVRGDWYDQTPRSGHEHRAGDIELFASLGMTSLRYPALWERISPDSPEQRDFRWTDERLPLIRDAGMQPILTLCHHGSGPHYTSLVDDSFAPGLARHAKAVAERYPWVRDWTPVNEPLTTARFSALYGYWYPHTTSEPLFWTALLNEIDATRLSMREIRRVNPQARLIQTDDLGYCHSTEPLACEADYQNQRRWIGWDLLCGMVTPEHPLWERIASHGLAERLRVIADDPCPPDVIGVNHYLASERLLDHRLERHENRAVADKELGDCGGLAYVDVDAIRNREEGVLGLPALLRQAWERYGRTVAVTECHNGASREDQVRWFVEVWDGVERLRADGADICAVTAWSLLGSHDWNRMVTQFVGHYEVGVYDVRSGEPRPTMLAPVLKDLVAGRRPSAVGLERPGWWRRIFQADSPVGPGAFDVGKGLRLMQGERPLLIVGTGGPLTEMLAAACDVRGLPYVRRPSVNEQQLRKISPWAVVDGRDWGGVCHRVGSIGRDRPAWPAFHPPEQLVRDCAAVGAPLAVFAPVGDFDEVEERLLSQGGESLLLVKTDRVFAPWERAHPAVAALDALECGLPVQASAETAWEETYGPDLVDVTLDLIMDGVRGGVTLAPRERCSVASFLRRLAEVADCPPSLVVDVHAPTVRPVWMVESPATVDMLPPGETTIERLVREARCARSRGHAAITRRRDEPHAEEVAG
jgi:dTDP-4-dehydrorhamnose reductase